MKYFLCLSALFFVGCSSSSKKNAANLSENQRLHESREYAPQFPYDEFFRTSGISNIVVSGDGELIYALKSDGSTNQIFVYPLKEKKWQQLTQFREAIHSFHLSLNGSNLIFAKDNNGNEAYDLFRLETRTQNITQLTDGTGVESSIACGVSDDGNEIFFSQSKNKRTERDIRVYNQVNNTVRILLPAKGRMLYCDEYNEQQKKLSILDFIENNEVHLGLIDLRSNSFQYLIKEKSVRNTNATFMNGALYFLSTKDSDNSRVWSYIFKTKKVELNEDLQNRIVSEINSYQNGKYLALKYRDGMRNRFTLYDSKLKPILPSNFAEHEIEEEVLSNGISEVRVTLIASADRPTQYYVEQGKMKELIYNSNQSRINEKFFATSFSKMITSFDGTQIPAHFFVPNGSTKKNHRPLIVLVHGGPEEHIDAVYSPQIQFLTNNGFVVVTPNVRGSTGFGKKFQMMDNGDWGGAHIQDLLAVTNYAKTLDFVDENNLFIAGGSFGGYSVLSMITQHATVYRAAVDIFGITDMADFYRNWPAAQTYLLAELGKDPTQDQEFNQKISPIYHVEKIQTPLQVHQGANDIRVSKTQSDMLVEKMRERNIPVEYHIYADEGHGFKHFANSKKCYESMVDFLKRYID